MARLLVTPITRWKPPTWPRPQIFLPKPVVNLSNNFDGGTNGVSITTTDTTSGDAWDVVSIGASCVTAWDNTHTAHGAEAGLFSSGGSAVASYVAWTTKVGSIPRIWGRAYVYITASPPTVTQIIARGLAATAQKFRLYINTSGKLVLADNANVAATGGTSTNNIPANQWVRVEWDVTAGTSAPFEVRYWTTADSAGTPTETLTGSATNFGSANFDEIRFGIGASFASVVNYWLDDVNANNIGFPGPVSAPAGGAGVQPLVPTYFCCPPWPVPPEVQLFAAPAAQAVVSAAVGVQPLVPTYVCCPPWPYVAPALISESQPLGNPAQPTESAIVVTPPTPPVLVPPVFLGASQPLGNPAQPTDSPLVVTPPTPRVLVPPVLISSSQPLGNPAVPTPQPVVVTPPPPAQTMPPAQPPAGAMLTAGSSTTSSAQPVVVTPTFQVAAPPGAHLSANPAAPAVIAAATPAALVVGPPWQPVPIPAPQISASQPLGNPAVGTPVPIIVSQPWGAKVPGALIFGPGAPAAPVVTTASPGPLVVTPPFLPVPVPQVYISASQPLGNPATGTPGPLVAGPRHHWTRPPAVTISGAPSSAATTPGPLVIGPTFTLAPVPGAQVFAAPSAPVVSTVGTPGPLVVTPPWRHVPIPRSYITASQPLGNPAVASPKPMVVTPPHRWPTWTASLVSVSPVMVASCDTSRPSTGITARPGSGTTAYALATTARSSSGTTTRPNSGQTDPPCG
jgi:hypothetical protein